VLANRINNDGCEYIIVVKKRAKQRTYIEGKEFCGKKKGLPATKMLAVALLLLLVLQPKLLQAWHLYCPETRARPEVRTSSMKLSV